MTARIDHAGQRFGRWLVLRHVVGSSPTQYECRCDCGREKAVYALHLRRGFSTSCGCYAAEVNSRRPRNHPTSQPQHGHAVGYRQSPTYVSWARMKDRCTNPKTHAYEYYGGRGITVSQRWLESFENFLADMGERPPDRTLDRYPDPDGNYEPGNCRWATKLEQRHNRGRGAQ